MAGFEGMGKVLIIIGIVIVVFGLLLAFGGKIPYFGKLPGDIVIRRDHTVFYFPIVSFLILSVLLSLIVNLVSRFFGK